MAGHKNLGIDLFCTENEGKAKKKRELIRGFDNFLSNKYCKFDNLVSQKNKLFFFVVSLCLRHLPLDRIWPHHCKSSTKRINKRDKKKNYNTHTHTHTYIYIYMKTCGERGLATSQGFGNQRVRIYSAILVKLPFFFVKGI